MKKLLYILALLIAFCSNLQAQKAKLSKEEFRQVGMIALSLIHISEPTRPY